MRTLILLALIGAAFAVPKNIQRIVGGSNTNVETYPYMSNLQYYNWWGSWAQACGGSLITVNRVLSAAHCFFGDSASSWRVRLGTSLRSSGGTVYAVSAIIMHPQYNDNQLTNDIAILRLSSNAALSNSVAVAGVAGANYNLADNTPVTTIGWGALWTGGPASEQLQHVTINVINHQLCAERYAYLKTLPGFQNWPDITSDMLCAGELNVGGKDACQGDSGGPLAHNRNTLVGVVSWGYQCAHSYWPGVNSRVSANINWIVSNT